MQRALATWPLAALFLSAGVGHFTNAGAFLGLMHGLPGGPRAHWFAVAATGVAEVALGGLLLAAPSRRGCEALCLLVVAMTPANVNMWWRDLAFNGHRLSYGWTGGHAKRACAQLLLLAWLWTLRKASFVAQPPSPSSPGDADARLKAA